MDKCIDKFLVNYNKGNVEKHSDSSDFDETQTVPLICPKKGNHSLLDKALHTHLKAKEKVSAVSCKDPGNKKERVHQPLLEDSMIPVRDTNQVHKKNRKQDEKKLKNKGDEGNSPQSKKTPKESQRKPTPCLSNIFRRSNNNAKQISSSKEIPENNLNSGKTFCADCERRRIKKLNRRRRSYVVQPVYVDNVQGGPVPFGHANDRAPLSQHNHKVMRKQDSNTSYELTSSDSEIGKTDQRKYLSRRRNFIDRFQKELRKEYLKYEKELSQNRVQQYPSKRDYDISNSVFSTPYCQVMNAGSVQNAGPGTVPTTYSGFWEYIYNKISGKHASEKGDRPCFCESPPLSPPQQSVTVPNNYDQFPPQPDETSYNELKQCVPECKSCIQQTEDFEMPDNYLRNQPTAKKFVNKKNVQCECNANPNLNKRRKRQSEFSRYPQMSMTPGNEVTRPCQEPHDDITRTVEEKYNGEILCIHNPPCILINGCLNLPNAKDTSPIQGNFWPVTQDKKTSFYHICRKMRQPKHKRCEQACQYHPPSIDVQAMQIKSEKIVQSICNHDPPCEVVYGCYKAKYDPKLENSCIHVPMCQRLPECWIEEREREDGPTKQCEHKPKCTEVPLCSRKFVVLTARGTVGTQVRPKSKLVCRHEPPCIMIPKCLARIISESYIPYDAIPDCVHQPCCDMIPACCRKAAKEMVSVSSQYPNAPCRIV